LQQEFSLSKLLDLFRDYRIFSPAMKFSHRIIQLSYVLFVIWIVVVAAAGPASSSKKKKTTTTASSGTSSSSSSSSSKKSSSSFSKDSDSSSADDNEKKIIYLRDKINKNNVVSLNDDNFSRFITDRPRDYSAVLMFTATDPMYKCSVCNRAKTVFEDVSKAYHSQYNFSTAAVANRVVFFRIEVDDARNIFGQLQLDTVPRFYSLPPTTKDSKKLKIESLEIEAKAFLDGTTEAIKLISEVTKVKIQILHDPSLVLIIAGVVGLLIALFVTYAQRNFVETCLFYQTPFLWSIVSIVSSSVWVSPLFFSFYFVDLFWCGCQWNYLLYYSFSSSVRIYFTWW
jgi:hypothetical protein